MSEELKAAIERAFINLHYALAELDCGNAEAGHEQAAMAHMNMAAQELLEALKRCRPDDDAGAQ